MELLGWIEAAHPGSITVLDVGGGGGFYEFPSSLRDGPRGWWGSTPTPGVLTRPWLDEGHQMLMEQYAPSSSERFDLALCVYVAEHVEDAGPLPRGDSLRPQARRLVLWRSRRTSCTTSAW